MFRAKQPALLQPYHCLRRSNVQQYSYQTPTSLSGPSTGAAFERDPQPITVCTCHGQNSFCGGHGSSWLSNSLCLNKKVTSTSTMVHVIPLKKKQQKTKTLHVSPLLGKIGWTRWTPWLFHHRTRRVRIAEIGCYRLVIRVVSISPHRLIASDLHLLIFSSPHRLISSSPYVLIASSPALD